MSKVISIAALFWVGLSMPAQALELHHNKLPAAVSNNKYHCVLQLDEFNVAFIGGENAKISAEDYRPSHFLRYNLVTNQVRRVPVGERYKIWRPIGSACTQAVSGDSFNYAGASGFGDLSGWIKGLNATLKFLGPESASTRFLGIPQLKENVFAGMAGSTTKTQVFVWGGSDFHKNTFEQAFFLTRSETKEHGWDYKESKLPKSVANPARFGVGLVHWGELAENSSVDAYIGYGGDKSVYKGGTLGDLTVIRSDDTWKQYTPPSSVSNFQRRNAALIRLGQHLYIAGGENEDQPIHSAFRVSFDEKMNPYAWQDVDSPVLSASYLGQHKARAFGQTVVFPSSGGQKKHAPLVLDEKTGSFGSFLRIPADAYAPFLWNQLNDGFLRTSGGKGFSSSSVLKQLKRQVGSNANPKIASLDSFELSSYVFAFEQLTGSSAGLPTLHRTSADITQSQLDKLMGELDILIDLDVHAKANADEEKWMNVIDLVGSHKLKMNSGQYRAFSGLKRTVYENLLRP